MGMQDEFDKAALRTALGFAVAVVLAVICAAVIILTFAG